MTPDGHPIDPLRLIAYVAIAAIGVLWMMAEIVRTVRLHRRLDAWLRRQRDWIERTEAESGSLRDVEGQ